MPTGGFSYFSTLPKRGNNSFGNLKKFLGKKGKNKNRRRETK